MYRILRAFRHGETARTRKNSITQKQWFRENAGAAPKKRWTYTGNLDILLYFTSNLGVPMFDFVVFTLILN